MKKLLAIIALLFPFLAVAVVIQGETSPGVYTNIGTDASGNLFVSTGSGNIISAVNSTSTLLGANGVFTGIAEDITKYAEIRVSVFSNQASATNGLQMQQSSDGVNYDNVDMYSIPAATGKTFGSGSASRYFRIVYTNGASAQGTFRLQVTYHNSITKPSAVRPQDGRSNDNDFEEFSAYNSIFNGVSWDRMLGTNGALTNKPYSVPLSDWTYAAAAGGISNTTTAVTMTVAGGAGLKNYITGCQLSSTALGVATELAIRDGAGGTVLWRSTVPAAGVLGGLNIEWPTPLRGTAATLVEVVTLTASVTGSVYMNCAGYTAP